MNKALEALEKAIAEEDSSEAYMLFGRALLLASASEPAERMLRRATEKLPADPLAFYYLADAAERRAHYPMARQALAQLLGPRRRGPRRPPARRHRGPRSPICRCA